MDPLNDPRFPNRPTHPDYWRIAEVAMQQDGKAEEGKQSVPQILEGVVDHESATYAATNRALIMCQKTGLPEALAPVLAAVWLDAFSVGVRFQQRGGHQGD